jgi:hypothetical protein
MCVCMYVCMYVRMCVCMYVCVYVWTYVCTYIYVCTYVRTHVCVSCVSYNKCLLFPHTIFNDFLCNVQELYSLCSRNWSLQIVRGCRDTQIYQNKYFKVSFLSLTYPFINKYILGRRKSISKLNESCLMK